MSFDAQRLYELLPAVYRLRDAGLGEPLRALLAVIAGQATVLEEDLAQLYDDQFIETCADWVVPYIGDLIGYRSLYKVAPKVGRPRAEVGHTIGFRRRKGTAAMLEQLARDVTGWNARVVEFFQLLGWTQYMNHLRPTVTYAPDVRDWEQLEHLDGPFETTAHTVDVRHIALGLAKYNIPNVGIFLWRLSAYPLTDSPAFRIDARRYFFNPLGLDTQLFTRPETEPKVTHLAQPINVPDPISRRVLDAYLTAYFGKQKSIFLRVDGSDVDISQVEACNLSDAGGGNWIHQPQSLIAIDPVLGRIAFPLSSPPPTQVLVTFHYGFSADSGGGEYVRLDTLDALLKPVASVPAPHATVQDALNTVGSGGAAEISDSGRYAETPAINIARLQPADPPPRLELRAADGHRPTLVLNGDLQINGDPQSTVTLNGLLINGGSIRIAQTGGNQLQVLRLRHCTLVPGSNPSLIVDVPGVTVEIDHCIVGALRIRSDVAIVRISDSILDATDQTAAAFAAINGAAAGGPLRIENSTIIGKVNTVEMQLASNTIFVADLAANDAWTAPVRSERKQQGCVRFCYLPPVSVLPQRYACQPANEADALRLRPRFTSLRYGDPGYCQLSQASASEIRTGADDESEMGAFHQLYQPQRQINLKVRLEEYLRVGLEAGSFYVT